MSNSVAIALLGLTAAISWGISDFFAAKSAKSIGSILASTLVNISGALLFAIIFVLFFRSHTQIPATGFWYTAGSAIMLSFGAATFFVALEAGPVSIVSPLTSMYPLGTTALALLLFHARLTARELAGIALTLLGIITVSGLLAPSKPSYRLGKGSLYALLTAFNWGVGYALISQALKYADWQIVSLIEFCFVTLTFIALVPIIKGPEVISLRTIRKGFRNKFVIGTSGLQLLGVIALNVGLSKSTATGGAVVAAISATYPVLTIFLALRHFDEKMKLVPLAGAFVGIAGVIALSLG